MVYWKSLWHSLLYEAAKDASTLAESRSFSMARVATAVIVARAALEAYINEFRVLRDITLPRVEFKESIRLIFLTLDCAPPDLLAKGPWQSVELLNRLRNALVHNLSQPMHSGKSPRNIIEALAKEGLPSTELKSSPWEEVVLVPWTARWSCRTAGEGINRLEQIPSRRRRSLREVQRLLGASLQPLSGPTGSSQLI